MMTTKEIINHYHAITPYNKKEIENCLNFFGIELMDECCSLAREIGVDFDGLLEKADFICGQQQIDLGDKSKILEKVREIYGK